MSGATERDGETVFRCKETARWIVPLALIYGGASAAILVPLIQDAKGSEIPIVLGGLAILMAYLVWGYRLMRARAVASAHGLRVINPLGTHDLDWRQIDAIELTQHGRNPSIAVVRTGRGETIPIVGIQGVKTPLRHDTEDAEHLVREIERLRAQYQV